MTSEMIPVSLLSAYLYCPRKIYLEKVLKLTEPTREGLLMGKVKHTVFSNFSEREREIISNIFPEHSYNDILKLFEDVFDKELKNAIMIKKKSILRLGLEPDEFYNKIWPVFKRDISSRVHRIYEFIQKEKKYGLELFENLMPKTKSEYDVESETMGLKGRIDQVLVYEKNIVPLEIKSGKKPSEGIWAGNKVQLSAYIMLLEEKFGINLEKGIIYYLPDDFRELYMNPFLKSEVLKTRDLVNTLLNSKELPPITKKEGKCDSCGLKKECHNEEHIGRIQQKTLNTT